MTYHVAEVSYRSGIPFRDLIDEEVTPPQVLVSMLDVMRRDAETAAASLAGIV